MAATDPNTNYGDLTGATSRVRRGGSGATYFVWDSQVIGFAQQVGHSSPQPVAAPVAIQPLDARYPIEIMTPLATGMGEITVVLYELYGQQVWDRLTGITGAVDLVDVFYRVSQSPNPIQMVKVVKPPLIRGKTMKPYTYEYHNCVITDIGDGETISVETMEVMKTIKIAYTHMTRGGQYSFTPRRDANGTVDTTDLKNQAGSLDFT